MRVLKYITFVVVALIMTACKQEQYYLFNDEARIQFGPTIDRIYTASYDGADQEKSLTFYYQDPSVAQDTVLFDIYAVGGVSTKDRTFALQQMEIGQTSDGNQVNNAVPGKHYVAFNAPEATKNFVIKAGTIHAKVPIILLRDESLKTSTQTLAFRVIENDDFKVGEASRLTRKVTFTDRLSRPDRWDEATFARYYLGKYSIKKHEFMIEVTGQDWDQDFLLLLYSESGLLSYWTGFLKVALMDYNNEHPGEPLLDENKELIVFP